MTYNREKKSFNKSRSTNDPEVTISTQRFKNNYGKYVKDSIENMSILGRDGRISGEKWKPKQKNQMEILELKNTLSNFFL